MIISYQSTEDDFVRAGRLMQRRRGSNTRFLRWIGGIVLVVIALNFLG